MRLLLEQNLSPYLVDALQDLYLASTHVRDVGLAGADDEAIWTFAAEQGLSIDSLWHERYADLLAFGQDDPASFLALW